jgi:hypothetical protein
VSEPPRKMSLQIRKVNAVHKHGPLLGRIVLSAILEKHQTQSQKVRVLFVFVLNYFLYVLITHINCRYYFCFATHLFFDLWKSTSSLSLS